MLKFIYTVCAIVTVEVMFAICYFALIDIELPVLQMAQSTESVSSSWQWGHDSTGLIATLLSLKAMSYRDAVEYCFAKNSVLAEIDNINDYQFFNDILVREKLANMSVWVGHAYDKQNNVWRRVSNNKTISWDGWKPRTSMNQSEPHSYGLSLFETLPFFCVMSEPRELLKKTLSSIPTVESHFRAGKDFNANVFNKMCTGALCFDPKKCQSESKIKIHIQEVSDLMSLGLSVEFFEFYIWLKHSPYYTENPANACLIVPDLDFLATQRYKTHKKQVGEYIQNNSYWRNGSNHVIFNFVTNKNDFESLPIGNSLLASSSLRHSTIRLGFDVSIPYYSHKVRYFAQLQRDAKSSERTVDLVAAGNIKPEIAENLAKFIATDEAADVVIVQVADCDDSKRFDIRKPACDQFGMKRNVGDLFAKSRYCLITDTSNGEFQNSFFSFALRSGCIPLIVAPDHVLPYTDVIDWTRAVLSIAPYDILSLGHFLNQLSRSIEQQKREQCIYLFDRYFKSMGHVASSFVDYMQQRLNIKVFSYEHWNGKQTTMPTVRVFGKAKDNGFTAVILTYDRFDYLVKLIEKLATVRSCKKILIIWQNQSKPRPEILTLPRVGIPVIVKKVSSNVLSNRFYPHDDIKTNCVLSIDDDMDFLTTDEFEFGYATWRSNPDRLVGYPSRNHYNNGTNWVYDASWGNDVTMILTGAAFYHNYYNYAYTYQTPKIARDYVDKMMNCEDLLMNYVVKEMSGKAPLKVTPRRSFKSPSKEHIDKSLIRLLYDLLFFVSFNTERNFRA